MTEPTPEQVVWTPGYLKSLGQKYQEWSRKLDDAHIRSLSMILTPGSYREAVALKEQFEDRRKLLSERLDDLRATFADIGANLILMEQNYETTEDVNKDDVVRLQGLVDAVAAKFPSVDKVMPTAGGFPAEVSKPPPKKPTKEES
jgi:hypothetical protein